MDVFEEGDQGHELFIFGVAFPGLEDNGVFWLFLDMFWFGVDNDYFREVAVEVGEVLFVLVCVLCPGVLRLTLTYSPFS